jgi:hypothetical protein
MKKTLFVLIGILMLSLTSCTQEDAVTEPNQRPFTSLTPYKNGTDSLVIDTAFVKEMANDAIVSFVTTTKKSYSVGMTYEDFKAALDPDDGLAYMQVEGDELVKQAYDYITNDVGDSSMQGDKMMKAMLAIIDYSQQQGAGYTYEVDFDKGSQWLFGLNENSQTVQSSDPCKWWQLGCHWKKIWKWLSTEASGGGASNGETLGVVVGIVVAIISIFLG